MGKSTVSINNVCIILSKCDEHSRGQTQNTQGAGLIMRDTAKVVMMALLMASISLAGCFGEEAKEEVEIPVMEENLVHTALLHQSIRESMSTTTDSA